MTELLDKSHPPLIEECVIWQSGPDLGYSSLKKNIEKFLISNISSMKYFTLVQGKALSK